MLTGNMHAQRFGMPDYIRNLRRRPQAQPAVQSQPLGPVGEDDFSAMIRELNASAPPPRQANAAPMGLMQQAAPQHMGKKPGMDMGLFNQSFEKPKMTWSDKLGIASGYLMDLDGSFGTGNADKFRAMYDERVNEQRSEFERKRQEAIMLAAAQGDPTALAYLDPLGNRSFQYNRGRDGVLDDRYNTAYKDTRADRADDVGFRDRVQNFREMDANRGAGFEERRLGLEGRRVTAAEAAAAAEATQQGAGMAPALSGLPAGVQSAIVTKELTGLDSSEEAVGKARNAANIARAFMADSEGYGSLGGGPLADIGQAASQRTAQLKGHTARMIPMMRSPGEGEMTDSDAKRYELSVVSINKGRAANQSVVDDLERFEANEVARDKFLREWQSLNGYGSVGQAKLIWQQYADAEPIFDPETGKPRERKDIYSWMGGASQAPQATGAPAPTSKQEYDALPSGAVFQAPDGSMRRKP